MMETSVPGDTFVECEACSGYYSNVEAHLKCWLHNFRFLRKGISSETMISQDLAHAELYDLSFRPETQRSKRHKRTIKAPREIPPSITLECGDTTRLECDDGEIMCTTCGLVENA